MIKTLPFKKTEESILLGALTLISGDLSFYDRVNRHNLPSTEVIQPFHGTYVTRAIHNKPQNFFCFPPCESKTNFLIHPEAYFYTPKAQRLFMEGCIKHANNNNQIILFTESVYIFNELRIAIMEKKIGCERVIIYQSHDDVVEDLKIEGSYLTIPHNNFLNEWDIQLDRILTLKYRHE